MIEILEGNHKKILLSSMIATSIAIVISYAFKKSLVLISIIGMALSILAYAVARKDMEEGDVEKNFKSLIMSIMMGVFGIIHHMFYSTVYKKVSSLVVEGDMFSNIYESAANSAFVFSFLLNAVLFTVLLIFLRDEERKEKFNKLKDMSIKPLDKKSRELNDEVPDVILCRDADTGEPVIWPHDSRYTHMLCLGPTGSGKTSQTIIPLIYQDIQKKNVGITVLEPKGAIISASSLYS